MDNEGLKCRLFDVCENDDHSVLHTLLSSCRKYQLFINDKIGQGFLYEKGCTEKKSVNTGKMSALQQEMDTTKSDADAVIFQQKITDKMVSNVTKSQGDLKDELKKSEEQKEALSLEMVDLQLEVEERKNRKILHWEAIKRACNIYKLNLDIHISLQEEKDCQNIKVSFFTHNEETKDKYFVQLSRSGNQWRIEQIEPRLKKEHLEELSIVKDSSEHSKVPHITLFLCQVRSIFLKHYMKTRKKLYEE